ncbi:hypothetical protein GCM10020295_76910 [Streptomyces cinereospinus]
MASVAGVQRTSQREVRASAPPRADDLPHLPVRHPAHCQPAQQQLTAPVEIRTQRIQPQVPRGGGAARRRAGQAQPRHLGLDRGGEAAARRLRGRAPAARADEHPLHRPRHGPPPPVRLTLREHRLHGLHQFAAPGRGQPAQPGEVRGEPADLPRVGGARGWPRSRSAAQTRTAARVSASWSAAGSPAARSTMSCHSGSRMPAG